MSDNEKALGEKIDRSLKSILKASSVGGDLSMHLAGLTEDFEQLWKFHAAHGHPFGVDAALSSALDVDKIVKDPDNPDFPKVKKIIREALEAKFKSLTQDPGNTAFAASTLSGVTLGQQPPAGSGDGETPAPPDGPPPDEPRSTGTTPAGPIYFSEIKPYPTADDPSDILFVRPPGGKPLPDPEAKFKRAIDAAARRVAAAFRGKRRDRSELLGQLAVAAFNGLGGVSPVLANGLDALENFKQFVADKANFLKQDRMYEIARRCGMHAAVAIALLAAYYAVSGYAETNIKSVFVEADPKRAVLLALLAHAHPFLLGFLGILLGFTLMGFVSNRELSFENFDRFGIYIVSVDYYLGYLAVLFAVFYILLGFDLVQFGIAGQSFGTADAKPWVGFLMGLSVAVGEQIYSQLVVNTLKPNEPAQDQRQLPAS